MYLTHVACSRIAQTLNPPLWGIVAWWFIPQCCCMMVKCVIAVSMADPICLLAFHRYYQLSTPWSILYPQTQNLKYIAKMINSILSFCREVRRKQHCVIKCMLFLSNEVSLQAFPITPSVSEGVQKAITLIKHEVVGEIWMEETEPHDAVPPVCVVSLSSNRDWWYWPRTTHGSKEGTVCAFLGPDHLTTDTWKRGIDKARLFHRDEKNRRWSTKKWEDLADKEDIKTSRGAVRRLQRTQEMKV